MKVADGPKTLKKANKIKTLLHKSPFRRMFIVTHCSLGWKIDVGGR